MSDKPRYQRILIKLSGESMSSADGAVIGPQAVESLVKEVMPVVNMGVQVAMVIGGGNIIRGRQLASDPYITRTTADYMGMLATVINALALQDAFESAGLPTRVMSAITMTAVCEPWIRRRAIRHLEKKRLVILAGGTGSPFFTTDTCAALRASEIAAEVLIKATKVNGVFDADPITTPNARRYDRLSYHKVLSDKLEVMDLTAIAMCMESRIPIIVFQMSMVGNLLRAVRGENVGTIVTD